MAASSQWRVSLEGALARGLLALPHGLLRLLVGRPITIEGLQLHVEAQLALKLLALAGEEPLADLSVPDARALVAADAQKLAGPTFALARVEEVPVDGAAGSLRGRLYAPERPGADRGLLVYFHGGGFVVCDLDTHDNTCRFLASESGVRVLSVDYRLAPEHPFPAAFDDACAAFRFAVAHAEELGADPGRIAVGGDSAGGNLAAGVARDAAGGDGPAPAFQLLFYPWLDLSSKRNSYRLFGEGFYLTEADLDWYRGHYVAEPADAVDPRCSPAQAADLGAVAPAYIATAGFDPLRDEGEEYGERLRAAGVPVAVRRHPGLIHAFVNTVGIGHIGRDAVLEAAGALRTAIALAGRG